MNRQAKESMHNRRQNSLNRRQALQVGCAIGSGLAGAFSAHANQREVGKGIAEIRMHSDRLDELREFYEEQLELPAAIGDETLTVEAGTTRLIFSPDEAAENEPFYHFAFNIPENQIESACQWQKKRTPLLRRGGKEIIHFSGINAHSVYFNDPAGNIVEYIARHDLNNSEEGAFGPKQILYASEIGLVVDNVSQTQREIKDTLGLTGFPGSFRSQSFSPVGDAHALLILVKRNRMWFPNKKQAANVHPVWAKVHGRQNSRLHNAELDYTIDLTTDIARTDK